MVGSFLNVCIHRVPKGRSVVRPRSRCPNCGKLIRPWENIPLLSYIFLKGKCSDCGARISWVYPTVEATTALVFFLLFRKYGFGPTLLVNMVFLGMVVALIFIDLFDRLLPNVITLSGMLIGLLTSPWQSPEFFGFPRFLNALGPVVEQLLGSIVGIVVGGGVLWLVAALYLRYRKIEGMGFGDIKMMAMVGAFLGWQSTWLTILLGSFLGAIVGSAYIFVFAKGRRYELPFGSFLGLGAIVSTLWGRDIMIWYFG